MKPDATTGKPGFPTSSLNQISATPDAEMLNIKVSTKFALLSALIFVSLALLGASILYQRNANLRVEQASDNRYHSYLLASEMRQSSDDLTRLARTYAVTADKSYKDQYFRILDIRDGKAPRPEQYNRIYWDFVAAGRDHPRPDGPPVALLELMKRAGFSPQEFDALTRAKANSDGLVKLEVQAMNLVEGVDRGGHPTEADLAKARDLMHSPQYHQYKAQIMQPVDEFFVALDNRTQAALDEAEAASKWANGFIAFSTATVFTTAIALCAFVAKGALKPLRQIEGSLTEISRGRYEGEIVGQDRQDEIGAMARAVRAFQDAARSREGLQRTAEAARAEREVEQARAELAKDEAVRAERQIVVESIGSALAALADKDFRIRMTGDVPEAYRQLQADFDQSVASLQAAIGQVAHTAIAIESGAAEFASASNDLSHRTEQQATSLEETAAAVSAVAETLRASSEGIANARELVVDADRKAKAGFEVVSEATQAMDSISNSAREIGKIIGVIDEIAFQTNLLALNAGVEAARAGEAGRGFAVVASEVRALAQRSAEAAREIKTLILESTGQVEEGARLVSESGNSLREIADGVNNINAIFGRIVAEAHQQSVSIREINQAIVDMDRMTQQNAAMSEEASAASRNLNEKARELGGLVAQFKIDTSGRSESPPSSVVRHRNSGLRRVV